MSYLDIIRHQRPNIFAILPVLELEMRDRASPVVPHAQMKSDPRHVHGDEFITVAGRILRLRSVRRRFHYLAWRAHADPIVRRQIHLIIVPAPQPRQHETVDLVGDLHLLPFARFPFVVEDITPDRGAAIVPVLPLDVDRITRRAGRVKQRGSRWNCEKHQLFRPSLINSHLETNFSIYIYIFLEKGIVNLTLHGQTMRDLIGSVTILHVASVIPTVLPMKIHDLERAFRYQGHPARRFHYLPPLFPCHRRLGVPHALTR